MFKYKKLTHLNFETDDFANKIPIIDLTKASSKSAFIFNTLAFKANVSIV